MVNTMFILTIILGALSTYNFSVANDNVVECVANSNSWPHECKEIMVQFYSFRSKRISLYIEIPYDVALPATLNRTQCETEGICSCNCGCTGSNSRVLSTIQKPNDSIQLNFPPDSGCYQFVAYNEEGGFLKKSCCVYFPDSDDVPSIRNPTTPVSSPKPPSQDTGFSFVLPLIVSLAVIFCMACLILTIVYFYKYRRRPSELCRQAEKGCSVPLPVCNNPAIRILLVHMHRSRDIRHAVKFLQANLEEQLKCTVEDVNNFHGNIVDGACIEQFLNAFHKILVIFPRASSQGPDREGVFPPLENFYTLYLNHTYSHEKILAVSLEKFAEADSDHCALPRVYTIPTHSQKLVQDLLSSFPIGLAQNQAGDLQKFECEH